MDEADRTYVTSFRSFGAVAVDRKFEIVPGKAFSAATQHQHQHHQPYPSRRTASWSPGTPPLPPLPPPLAKRSSVRSASGAWCFSDPEVKRKRRVAGYKAYSIEGKVKASFLKGIRWFKSKIVRDR